DVEDLAAGVLEHLAHGALAEVQAVVGAGIDFDEALEPVHAAKHAVHPAETLVARHAGVVRVARHAYFVLFRNGDHALEKVSDARPGLLLAHRTRLGEGRVLRGLAVDERAVARPAAA